MNACSAAPPRPPAAHEPGTYLIRVVGWLGPEWADRLEGLSLEVRQGADGAWQTDLTGAIVDHAALMGILDQLAFSGARLVEVRCLDDARPAPPAITGEGNTA